MWRPSGAFLLAVIYLMLDTILAVKQKMGAVYISDRRFPVTWVKVDPCVVTQIKHKDKDGYYAIQLGSGSKRTEKLTKPLQNHLKNVTKNKIAPKYLREVRLREEASLKVGDVVKLTDVLKKGDVVSVTGISKGKGFAGVVKRWGFAGGPKTHGQSDRERAPGSIGQRTTPGRVYKGKKMAGRMGGDQVSVKGLLVVEMDENNNLVAVVGAIPGKTGGLLYVKKIGERDLKLAGTDIKEAEIKDIDAIKEDTTEKVEDKKNGKDEGKSQPEDKNLKNIDQKKETK